MSGDGESSRALTGICVRTEDELGNIVHHFFCRGEALNRSPCGSPAMSKPWIWEAVSGARSRRAPDLYFLRETALSETDEPLQVFLRGKPPIRARATSSAMLHRLMNGINATLAFRSRADACTHHGARVLCHAHGCPARISPICFIGCARYLGIPPARYVSGYFVRVRWSRRSGCRTCLGGGEGAGTRLDRFRSGQRHLYYRCACARGDRGSIISGRRRSGEPMGWRWREHGCKPSRQECRRRITEPVAKPGLSPFQGSSKMTYCVGLLLDRAMVLIADTRTNAGLDQCFHLPQATLVDRPGRAPCSAPCRFGQPVPCRNRSSACCR